jgi:DNA-binding transcriptional LysR family regulator
MTDWNDLKYVLETVRHGGLSGAARVLKVNHATVSRRIGAIETAMGARLFDRLPQGYAPTAAGYEVANSAEKVEAGQLELERKLAGQDAALSGPLVVTAPSLLIERVLCPMLLAFTRAHPEIDVSIVASNASLNLNRREADVAFHISDSPTPSLVGVQVSGQKAAVYAQKDLVTKLGDPLETTLDWIRFAHWPGLPAQLHNAWPDLRVRVVVDDMVSAIGAARAGMGATRMPCFLGDSDPELARVPGVGLFDYPSIWILTHPDLRATRRVTAFMGFAAQQLRGLRPQFEGQVDRST